jgi:hypothetical protein
MLYLIPEWCRITFKSRSVRHAASPTSFMSGFQGRSARASLAEVDFGQDFPAPGTIPVDAGVPAVMQFIYEVRKELGI